MVISKSDVNQNHSRIAILHGGVIKDCILLLANGDSLFFGKLDIPK